MLEESGSSSKVLKDYILYPQISIHDPYPEIIPRELNGNRLYCIPQCSQSTKLTPKRDYITGEIVDFEEEPIEDVGASAVNSMSMRRAPGCFEEITRGSTMNFPFCPAGFNELSKELDTIDFEKFISESKLETKPPGFSEGISFENCSSIIGRPKNDENMINLLEALEESLEIKEWMKLKNETNRITTDVDLTNQESFDSELFKSDFKPVLEISKSDTNRRFKTEWAEMVDISHPVENFNEKIPEPALTYPFELDIFQKQAILKLEERQYVFVSAHTSAGKTVVAEYAIAMSQKHMTRTIYTSPIKALSNQKYRDFKKMFKDVGLITGDLQIDPAASCLIMTTEILRSMLYCGSDITRDLEYVIFDEVHYINDSNRGHVWEEVIILLPDHVNIIMLSATVPNTLELADWVGSTKKRKVYVISTLKRPVPLLHYLYTGCGGKSKNDIFLLVDAEGKFLKSSLEEAKQKKEGLKKDQKQKTGSHYNPKQNINLWIGMLDYLKRNNKLPVVAFTLSRNRCDYNANALLSSDLNTGKEKAAVQNFFQKCLQKLKPPDRVLPQVLSLKDSLERGIGIHHSGILPILKEIVEMLFQVGLVKLLFATETFAMGVNMPAKTVIFDSLTKYDGDEVRALKPAEYIQMAGRAGRRGHDANGTVILICKENVPSELELRSTIQGQPEKLQSKFLLRYAMILTCLRIESIKVEDIMQFSFKEYNIKQQIPEQQKQLKIAENEIINMKKIDEHLKPLVEFYDIGVDYIEEKQRLMKKLLKQPKIVKKLKPGKILIVTKNRHYNKLGILLSMKNMATSNASYKVLVLDHKNISADSIESANQSEQWHSLIALSPQNKFFHPEGIGGHCVLDINSSNIIDVVSSSVKIDADIVIKNWDQRQIERFRDTPPSPSVVKAVSDLQTINNNYIADPKTIQIMNLAEEVNVMSDSEIDDDRNIQRLWDNLTAVLPHTNIIGFEQEFSAIFIRKSVEKKIEILKFKNSAKNLSLYPDYLNKLEVLRALKYIDESDEVTLKGKVACEMGSNELIITELILCNFFNDLEPAEIAALLSGLVFQAKVKTKPTISKKLKKCVEEFYEISNNVNHEESRFQVDSQKKDGQLNFGLIEVVYEWARNKPFAEIMTLTEIQEGIIVRCIVQLDETVRDVKTAAMRIGNPALQSKMEEASNAIKRDIVFAASLYTTC